MGFKLLIVDDEVAIRTSLTHIFASLGQSVRSAEDGFSALCEIRQVVPDILLSDLNMPGMSGFELLSVVRRRFPLIQVIAMSGAFSGEGIPPGVAADAFYEKGTTLNALLQIMSAMTHPDRASSFPQASPLALTWMPREDVSQRSAQMVITCPECLRSFTLVPHLSAKPVQETTCVYCRSSIDYVLAETTESPSPYAFPRKPGAGTPTPLGHPGIVH